VSGRRSHDRDELTDAEQRVATLAARGRHNKEIAAELYIGVGTVEAHLSRVYRKLGVRSRTELAGQLAVGDRCEWLITDLAAPGLDDPERAG
jgi:DNA-binding NarL/FixJ family response regulator